jgi:hypothetical protein
MLAKNKLLKTRFMPGCFFEQGEFRATPRLRAIPL